MKSRQIGILARLLLPENSTQLKFKFWHAIHGISGANLRSIPWVFIQVIPILFTFGLCNITTPNQTISDLYILSQFLWIRILYYWRTLSLFSLFICFESMTQSLEKSPRFYRFLKLCNSCLRLLLQIHFPPPQRRPLQRVNRRPCISRLLHLEKTRI